MKRNFYSTDFLERFSVKRKDESWLNTQLNKASTQIIPIWNTKILYKTNPEFKPIFLSVNELTRFDQEQESLIFLGKSNNDFYFALDTNSKDQATLICDKTKGEFVDMKNVAQLLNYEDGALLSLARFMTSWNATHSFCGKCGSPTKFAEGGNLRICSNENCNLYHFPSMDPAVIVLIYSGDSCLLGRKSYWPDGMYSTIAGFVEPGESIEDAVVREAEEETGITVTDIEYHSSQPWLFPGSLMLGFFAKATNRKIKIDTEELEDARWFSRKEIKENLNKNYVKLSSKVSIAYMLIKTWYEQGDLGKLEDK